MAISQFIARRIWKTYRREATVIYPPVDVESFVPGSGKEDFYVTASRMVPYKRMDLIVAAFAEMPNRRLVVIGDGPEMSRVRARARSNVEFLGYQEFPVLRDHLQRARAFVFAAEEDFGIAPLEAQACGTPVIGYGRGGLTETIRGLDDPRPTGVLFYQQTADAIKSAVERFEERAETLDPGACRANAMHFAPERFRAELRQYVETQLTR
jgi:glycosyltransferase involved in cell wall biosynthesis